MDLKKNQTLYDPAEDNASASRVSIFVLIGVLLALLVSIRFSNLAMRWIVNTIELTSNPLSEKVDYTFLGPSSQKASGSVDYTFLGLSSHKTAEEKCLEITGTHNVSVAAYFNFLHPAVFVIRNNNKKDEIPVDLGKMVVMAEPGLSTYTYTLSGIIKKERNDNKMQVTMEKSLLSKQYTPLSLEPGTIFISFVEKTQETLNYLHIPYMIYFYLPLVLIALFASSSSKSVLAAFLYYPGLFLLFDFKEVFANAPFQWLFKLLEVELTDSLKLLIAVAFVALFFIVGVIGLLNWKKQEDLYKERLIIFTFLLLPLFLRF